MCLNLQIHISGVVVKLSPYPGQTTFQNIYVLKCIGNINHILNLNKIIAHGPYTWKCTMINTRPVYTQLINYRCLNYKSHLVISQIY